MNLTDREMLELAAKAVGHNLVWGDVYIVDGENIDCTDLPYVRSNQQDEADWYWNPLEDGSDALRLAVECGINPVQCTDSVDAMHFNSCIVETEMFEDHNGDKCAATRRAIVRAAAAIQLSKEGK